MSYILEALRKAERERNPAQPDQPQVITRPRITQISSLQQLRPYRPVLVAGLCLSLMIALVILLFKDRHAAAPTDIAQTASTPAPAPAVQLSSNNSAMQMTQMYGDGRGPATLDDLMDAGAEPTAEEAPLYSDVSPRGAFSDPSPVAEVQVPEEATVPALPAEPVRAAAPPAPATSVERVQLDPAPPPQITKLRDMSPDYRAAFPVISLDVHSYDNAAKKRFIMIAGKRYNEGDALAEGPRIAQIVPEGVVFDFRGEQVLFTIAH